MTTKITVLNEGPSAVRMSTVMPNGRIDAVGSVTIEPGQFSAGHTYVHSGQSFRIDEIDGYGKIPMDAQDSDIIEYGTVRGEQNTIHASEHLDVEVNAHGHVVAVWFRCARLPFKQVQVDEPRASDMRGQREQVNKYGLMAVTMRRKT